MTQDDILNLSKEFELNLEKAQFPDIPVMETKLAMDNSGSMEDEFKCGWVDHMIMRYFVAAMKFDDNHTLDVGSFNQSFKALPSISELPDEPYTKKYGVHAHGSTNFAPVIKNMAGAKKQGLLGKLFSSAAKLAPPAKVYLAMVTDGENYDRSDFEDEMAKVDQDNTFIQLIAIGNQVDLPYLKQVATAYKNVSLIHFLKPMEVTDSAFYAAMCNDKFKAWIEAGNK